jgi:peptidyl-prolyl cis-trans isomerase D
MSILERIRNKTGLAIIFVGGALALFVIGDALQSNGIFGAQATTSALGEVDGESIDIKYFEMKYNENVGFYKQRSQTETVDQGTMDMLREQTWQQVLQEYIMAKEFSQLGISVTLDELKDMVQGQNLHPQIATAPIFQNQQTGQFDPALVSRFLKNLSESADEAAKTQWAQFEQGIRKETEAKKYALLINKGIYTTALEAKAKMAERTQNMDYNMVALNFASIADSTIAESESDLKSYFNSNKTKYIEKDNTRKLDFVTFDIVPTAEDSNSIKKWVDEQLQEFATALNDTLYVDLNSDAKFDTVAHNMGFFPEQIQNVMFNSQIGNVVGPIFADGKYRIYKVSGIKEDEKYSMRASHILFKVDGPTMQDTLNTLKKAQEILAEIRRGADFGEKAAQYGTDGTSSRGGDLGWFSEGQMVGPFNDYVLKGNKGDMSIVKTQFGIHIVKITENKTKKLVCAGVLERAIEPGEQTINGIYNKASQFAAAVAENADFEAAAAEQGLTKRQSDNIRENDKVLSGISEAREIVRWAFNAKTGDVSDVMSIGNNSFMVAKLTGIREKGKADFENVKDKLLAEYRKEKKAEILIEKANKELAANAQASLEELATKLQTFVVPAQNQTFENANVTYVGVDNIFIGTLFGSKVSDKIAGPVKGDNAVYLYKITKKSELEANADLVPYKEELRNQNSQRIENGSFDLLKEMYNTKDNRYKFY